MPPSTRLSVAAGVGLGFSIAFILQWIFQRKRYRHPSQHEHSLHLLSASSELSQPAEEILSAPSRHLPLPENPGQLGDVPIHSLPKVAENADRGEIARLGVLAIHQVILHLEEALVNLDQLKHQQDPDDDTVDENNQVTIITELKNLLEQTVLIHERCQQQLTASVEEYKPVDMVDSTTTASLLDGESDVDSFVSAVEYIDLSDLPEKLEACSRDDHLYRAALIELNEGNIPHREVRSKLVHCSSDTEYLAKVHCIRLALDHLLKDNNRRDWLANIAADSVVHLLTAMEFRPDEFRDAYRTFLEYSLDSDNYDEILLELESRGIPTLNVYDVVVDFMVLDSLTLLQDPPQSLLAVIQNRWLSDNFKKTALDSAVWTLLVAKRKLLKNPCGFMHHFYSLIATIAPQLAWGFLSSDATANKFCQLFKDCWIEFLVTVFSHQTRFTCVEDLADDIQISAKRCIEGKFLSRLPSV